MNFILAEDYKSLSQKAADIIIDQINMKPASVLGLATGGTVLGTYRELIRLCSEGCAAFKTVKTFNLDEYANLSKDHPQSYHSYMCEKFFNHIDIPKEHIHIPDGMAGNLKLECENYESEIKESGGVDLQLLGIGRNGHIGFNEPGTPFNSRTHVVNLTESTRQANSRFFEDDPEKVPRQAITMGIRTIMSSKKILLLAAGEKKAAIIKKLLNEPPSTQIPASVLHLHPDVTVIVDTEAVSLLSEEERAGFTG